MRIFEIMMLVSNLMLWVVDRWVSRKVVGVASCLAIGVALLHFIFEGYRWQMVPLYGLTAGYMLYLFVKARRHKERSKQPHLIRSFLLPFLLAVSAILPILLPVFKIDTPSGPYSVGTVTYHWIRCVKRGNIDGQPRNDGESFSFNYGTLLK